jgi:hypothetical protein
VIRPRGEEVSTFVSTQVGQEVRQNPHRTQSLISSKLGVSRPTKPCFGIVTISRNDIVCVATARLFSALITYAQPPSRQPSQYSKNRIPARQFAALESARRWYTLGQPRLQIGEVVEAQECSPKFRQFCLRQCP